MRWIREKLKAVLDRRYVTRDELTYTGSQNIEVPYSGHVELLLRGADPATLRRRIDDAHRLANETARALETVLQREIELWQAVDDIREQIAHVSSNSS